MLTKVLLVCIFITIILVLAFMFGTWAYRHFVSTTRADAEYLENLIKKAKIHDI